MNDKVSTPWTFHRLIITLAFGALVFAFLVFGGFSLVFFAFLGLFLIPPAILLAILFWKPKPWLYLAAGIGISYLPILSIEFVIQDLANPSNPYGYAGTAMALLSVAWALPAGVLAVVQGRKGVPHLAVREGLRSWQGIYSIGVALLAVGAGLTSVAAYNYAASHQGGAFDFEPQASVAVNTENYMFSPSAFAVDVLTLTEVVAVNKDSVLHTFTYEVGGKRYSHDLLPQSTTRFLVFFESAGTIPYWCIPHQMDGMTGQMTVA